MGSDEIVPQCGGHCGEFLLHSSLPHRTSHFQSEACTVFAAHSNLGLFLGLVFLFCYYFKSYWLSLGLPLVYRGRSPPQEPEFVFQTVRFFPLYCLQLLYTFCFTVSFFLILASLFFSTSQRCCFPNVSIPSPPEAVLLPVFILPFLIHLLWCIWTMNMASICIYFGILWFILPPFSSFQPTSSVHGLLGAY